ncbi:protein of unknown function [Cupriavidus taiwanensis]|nr:protein of unknown function [Cupriavidus taiwanensis]
MVYTETNDIFAAPGDGTIPPKQKKGGNAALQ